MLWSIVYWSEKWNDVCLEKLCFMTREDTQKLCDEMNKEQNTDKYYVIKGETY